MLDYSPEQQLNYKTLHWNQIERAPRFLVKKEYDDMFDSLNCKGYHRTRVITIIPFTYRYQAITVVLANIKQGVQEYLTGKSVPTSEDSKTF